MNQYLCILFSLLGWAAFAAPSHAQDKAAAMELGKSKYIVCGACHGMDGKGMQPAPGVLMAPAYADSKIVKDAETMALVVMKGIQKQDTKYLGIMAPLEAALTDVDLAAVLTYVRNTWGGQDDVITEEQVAAWREKYKDIKQSVTRADIEKRATQAAGN